MTMTVSLVLVTSVVVLALLRFKYVGYGAAIVCALFGFYLADTDAADNVNDTVRQVTDAVSDIGQ
jgi:hypothetical protein